MFFDHVNVMVKANVFKLRLVVKLKKQKGQELKIHSGLNSESYILHVNNKLKNIYHNK